MKYCGIIIGLLLIACVEQTRYETYYVAINQHGERFECGYATYDNYQDIVICYKDDLQNDFTIVRNPVSVKKYSRIVSPT